jgi:hypothetical protein
MAGYDMPGGFHLRPEGRAEPGRGVGRRPRAGSAARLDHGVRRQLQRPGAQQALGRHMALRRRPGVELRHRRDRDHDRLDQERIPHRPRAPAPDRPGQGRLVDLGPDPDEHRERGRAARRQAGGDRLDPPAVPGRRARLLAGLLDARPGPVAGERRDRHHGGRQRPVRALRHSRSPSTWTGTSISASGRARSARPPGGPRSTTSCPSSSTWPWAAATRTASAGAPRPPARRLRAAR